MTQDPQALLRKDFKYFHRLSTRWQDVDIYGHINNVVFYSLFDTAVNNYLINENLLAPESSQEIFLVVETSCRYFREVHHPAELSIGVATEKIGTSSVIYRLGVFSGDGVEPSAEGRFVHVLVNRKSRRPCPIGERMRSALTRLHPQAQNG